MTPEEQLAIRAMDVVAPILADITDVVEFGGYPHFRLVTDPSGTLSPRMFGRYLADQLIEAGLLGGATEGVTS